MPQRFRLKSVFLIPAVILLCISCVSIPNETVELSIELGNQISSIEDSHIALLNKYFKEKRNEVDQFVMNEWAPVFTKKFFSKPEVKSSWDEIISNNNEMERVEFFLTIGQAQQVQINNKRLELIKPLEDLEKSIERKIRGAYKQAYAINSSLTSFLASASKLTENRNRYMNMFGVTDSLVTNAINKTDSAVSELLSLTNDVEQKYEAAKQFKNKIEDLINKL